MTYASEKSIDSKMTSTVDIKDNKASERCDTASSSSSSFSIITLKESPDEADLHNRLSSLPEGVSGVSVDTAQVQVLASSQQQQQLNGIKYPPDCTSLLYSATTTQAVADTLLTSRVICDKDVTMCVFVDHLERRMILKNKPKLNVTQLTAEMFSYSPSFHLLPAIVESLRSDDGPLSDASIASGDGYVADGGHLKSSLSSTSSPISSFPNVAMSVESSSSEKTDTVVSNRQQLSAKSSSDGIDSAVVCTPYSTQTSQDSADTVDNIRSSCRHLISDVTDDQAPQLLPPAADEMHLVIREKDEFGHAAMSRTADEVTGYESSGEDSEDETSVTSLKVEWDVGSDSEMPVNSETNVVNALSFEYSTSFVRHPLPNTVCSFSSLKEQARDFDRRWSDKLVARRACCACLSSIIVHHRVSTTADVMPTISIRLCSSIIDVICLIQRLIVVSGTWLQVICNSAFSLQHRCHSDDERFGQETAIMCPTSTGHAVGNTGIVHSGSENGNLQHCVVSEGLKNIEDSQLQQLISVSYV